MKLPVVLFVFRRVHTLEAISESIKKYNPPIIYVYGDGPRTESESIEVIAVQVEIKRLFDGMNVIYDFSEGNRGVKENIGGGALKTFAKEESAIFLEDDNLPSESFFKYCEDLIYSYAYDDDVLWICGTNYLGNKYENRNESYFFTKQLLPCGWASWRQKFVKYYDLNLKSLNESSMAVVRDNYKNKSLMRQEIQSMYQTQLTINKNDTLASWDRQMNFSVRFHDKLGIMPKVNLIKNIGADHFSVHGGTNIEKEMTSRFCEVENGSLQFPLSHPKSKVIDSVIENEVCNIILMPLRVRFMKRVARILKRILLIDPNASFMDYIKNR
ncbi:glycosyltransferase family 2 protein [bacterium]|nr:glycosyltransferase family 2 protein [bacterium]